MTEAPKWYLDDVKSTLKGANKRIIGPVERVMRESMDSANSQRDTKHLHPSEMAKNEWCIRQTWYKMNATEVSNPENLDLRRMNILAEGNGIHTKWQSWIWKAGILLGDFSCNECGHRWRDQSPTNCPECDSHRLSYREVPIKNEQYKLIGHADGEIQDEFGTALLEIKSVGLGTIRWDAPNLYAGYEDGTITLDELWKRIKRPLLSHLRQINIYMWATGIHDAIVIYEWKPSQEVKEFHVTYDPDLVAPLLEKADTLWDDIANGVTPNQIPDARKSKQPCRFCPYKKECLG